MSRETSAGEEGAAGGWKDSLVVADSDEFVHGGACHSFPVHRSHRVNTDGGGAVREYRGRRVDRRSERRGANVRDDDGTRDGKDRAKLALAVLVSMTASMSVVCSPGAS